MPCKYKRIEINRIVSFLDEYLNADKYQDYCKNGLQIQGNPVSNGIIAGVSISSALINHAIEKNINTLLVHHGLIWKNTDALQIKGTLKERLKLILENDINLIGYHLPLDADPKTGNNISIIKLFGDPKELYEFDVGFKAVFDPPITKDHIIKQLKANNLFNIAHCLNKNEIRSITAVSGGSSQLYEQACENGCDIFISGEIKEPSFRLVEELGAGYIALGHYNSEVFGVRNLCKVLKDQFNLQTEFIDIPNPY